MFSDAKLFDRASSILKNIGFLSHAERQCCLQNNCWVRLQSDGSSRRFWRLTIQNKDLCILAAPSGCSESELAESRSSYYIGKHLAKSAGGVPELYGYDEGCGLLLFEDLGNTRLYEKVNKKDIAEDEILYWYKKVVQNLVRLQYLGGDSFDTDWCWDSARYDKQVMTEKESNYFLNAFWCNLLGQKSSETVQKEFEHIASLIESKTQDYFLHRDFQSRNIMIVGEKVVAIDYQGGRLGPLGYDLASLLIDPYVELTEEVQESCIDYYVDCLSKYMLFEREQFNELYQLLSLQRNMQILGAFSFLFKEKKKEFFYQFIKPSLSSLQLRLRHSLFKEYKWLIKSVDDAVLQWQRRVSSKV